MVLGLIGSLLLALPSTAAADQVISTPGPLSAIYLNSDLSCQVQHSGDATPSFFGGVPSGSCRTEVVLNPGPNGSVLEGSSWQLDAQNLTGSGSTADPFVVRTVVDNRVPGSTTPATLQLTQTDSYVTGQESYRTSITLANVDPGLSTLTASVFHAADCFLNDTDTGFGAFDPAAGAIYCTLSPGNNPPQRVEGFVPQNPGSSYIEGFYASVFGAITATTSQLPNTVDTNINQDNGAAIGWGPLTLAANQSVTRTFVSQFGAPFRAPPPACVGGPPAVTITSDQGRSSYEAGDPASVTISASGSGLTSDPSAAHVPISTATSGSFSVSRAATNGCGTTVGSFSYRVLGPPVLGQSVNVEAVSGQVFVKLASSAGAGFIPLAEARTIPTGSILNTTAGTARVTTATDRPGQQQIGQFSSGIFGILQQPSQRGLTELRMIDARSARAVCGRAGRAQAARALSKKVLGLLRGDAHGQFRTRGRFSAATVRGTSWGVSDRCDGTLTRVTRGLVLVRDFRLRKNITVRAGRSYLAKAR